MAEHIQHDDDELPRGAGTVLALNMLVENMLAGMKNAKVQYAHAFGDDPHDQVSREGRKNYGPREDGGFSFCINLMDMLGLDGNALNAVSQILNDSNEAATGAAQGGGKHH